MEKSTKLKIVVIGPIGAGKSTMVNFLSDVGDISSEVRRTKGLRIVEFQVDTVTSKGRNIAVDVELWDCSGDFKYEPFWPVFFRDADGFIFVYAKGSTEHQRKDLEAMYSFASDKFGNLISNSILFVNNIDPESENGKPISLPKVEMIETNIAEKGDALRKCLLDFVNKILSRKSKEKKSGKNEKP